MIVVLFTMLIVVAVIPSNETDVASVKDVPVIVTVVPPSILPDDGKIPVMLGGVI